MPKNWEGHTLCCIPDSAVDAAYGRKFSDDSDRVAHLFTLYQKLTEQGK